MHQFLSCILTSWQGTKLLGMPLNKTLNVENSSLALLRGSEVPPPTLHGLMPLSTRTPQNGQGVFLLPPPPLHFSLSSTLTKAFLV